MDACSGWSGVVRSWFRSGKSRPGANPGPLWGALRRVGFRMKGLLLEWTERFPCRVQRLRLGDAPASAFPLVRQQLSLHPLEPRIMLSATAPGEIHGSKWNDLDADGVWDTGELGLEGWTIYSDTDRDGVLDGDEPFDVTDATGAYALTDLPPCRWTCSASWVGKGIVDGAQQGEYEWIVPNTPHPWDPWRCG